MYPFCAKPKTPSYSSFCTISTVQLYFVGRDEQWAQVDPIKAWERRPQSEAGKNVFSMDEYFGKFFLYITTFNLVTLLIYFSNNNNIYQI